MDYQDEPGHGNSIAAWTAVIVAIVGVSLATLGFLLKMDIATYAGAALTLTSIFIGPVLAKLGFGVSGKKS